MQVIPVTPVTVKQPVYILLLSKRMSRYIFVTPHTLRHCEPEGVAIQDEILLIF